MHNEIESATATTARPGAAPQPLPGAVFVLRKCRSCGQEKPRRSFYKQRGCTELYRLDCIGCVKAAEKSRQQRRQAAAPPAQRRCRHCRTSQPIAEFPEDRRYQAGRALICQTCQDDRAARYEEVRGTLECPDAWMPRRSAVREKRIDLGIAIAHATCPPGHCRSREEIAAYSGLTIEAVRRLELRALEKMRGRARKILAELGLEEIMAEGIRL